MLNILHSIPCISVMLSILFHGGKDPSNTLFYVFYYLLIKKSAPFFWYQGEFYTNTISSCYIVVLCLITVFTEIKQLHQIEYMINFVSVVTIIGGLFPLYAEDFKKNLVACVSHIYF